MRDKTYDRLRKILQKKGTPELNELSKELGINEYKTKQLLLEFLYSEISSLHPEARPKKYKYLYKIFKYFEYADDEKTRKILEDEFTRIVRLCNRRLKNCEKEGKELPEENILQKLMDTASVTIIGISYLPTKEEKDIDVVSYDLLTYLIYEVENYNYLYELFKTFPSNLTVKNDKGVYLIEELVNDYIKLAKNNEWNADIIYFEKVIKLFLNDPKFYVSKEIEERILKKLKTELERVKEISGDTKEAEFFINEAINDVEKNEYSTIKSLNHKYKINPDFSSRIIRASNKIILPEDAQTVDCRNKYTITIDSDGTWAYDDACSLERLDNGNYLLGIYVTDVASYIPRNSDIDLAARNRVETIYLPDGPYTMLPKGLTERLSLREREDKRAIGFFFEIDQNLNIRNFDIRKCLINIDKNYSYETANDLLASSSSEEEIMMLKNLYQISNKMHADTLYRMKYRALKKLKKEMVTLEELTSNDLLMNQSSMMIAEFMTIVNNFVASYFANHPEIPFIYRVNLSNYGEDVIDRIKSIGKENLSFDEMIRYIKYICPQSYYSVNNLGHNGLSLSAYCHATNPLRNYSSLEIQRIIIDYMINDGKDAEHIDIEQLRKLCDYMNERIGLDNDYVEEVKEYYKKQSD